MFQKILIANRGEIALRILRACKTLGVESVVAYSEADRDSLAAQLADQAICMRRPLELPPAIRLCGAAAKAAFGDASLYLELWLEENRHVEVQVAVDRFGHGIHLGERDCSVQRRHQKILEEAPSPALTPEGRAALADRAIRAVVAAGYENAGTAEFMLDGRDFWFLELNGRIQVEHPVTELVTGVDLVQAQLRIAAGEPLAMSVDPRGHAVEVRLYAEDPRTFFPQTGRIERLRLPSDIRVDAGVAEGDEIGIAYDPMIAKLIAHGTTRADALAALRAALDETEVAGVTTNLPFLRWLVSHPAVRAGETTTSFLVEHPPLSRPPVRKAPAAWRRPFRLNLPPP